MRNKPKSFNLKSYAKVNLFLHILKKGKKFHNLESLAFFVNLYDEIKLIEDKKFSLTINGRFKALLKNKKNIIKKTIFEYSKLIKIKPNFKVILNKNIPLSAGLGGGSSNAAAVIKGINLIKKKNIQKEKVYKFAMSIGSDVPICLENKNVFFSGYGEKISKAPKLPNFYLVLANPMIELSTKKVFSKFEKINKKNLDSIDFKELNSKNFFSWILNTQNNLSKPAIKIVPEIKKIINTLDKSKKCILSRMTGSGATVFGLFKRKIDANKANLALKKKNPKWWSGVYSAKT